MIVFVAMYIRDLCLLAYIRLVICCFNIVLYGAWERDLQLLRIVAELKTVA